MRRPLRFSLTLVLCCPALVLLPEVVCADESFAAVAREVNKKAVKIFGAGGFRGVTAYCSGVLVSPEGHILTVYSPTLDSRELRVHLYDGMRYEVELLAAEPQLDVALLRIKDNELFKAQNQPYFDLSKKRPEVKPGDWVLAFSNLFEIATRDEPVSVQHGVVAAVTPLTARRGVHEASYRGTVFILDAVTNNPGAHGGIVTTRKGELIGLIGKELRNTLTETWVNYAMPVKDLAEFVAKAKAGTYKPIATPDDPKKLEGKGGRHGLVLVPDVLEVTPPYVDEVLPGSPAAKAGIKPNDLILMMRVPQTEAGESEDQIVSSCKVFKQAMAQTTAGMSVKLTIRRGMQLMSFDLILDEQPKSLTSPSKPANKGDDDD